MDELINDFIAETRDMLQALSGALVAWEMEPEDRARLDEIFRFVHTVKGNCGFFDLPRLQQLSHAAEDALAEVRAGRRKADPQLVGAVLAILDRIGALVEALESGDALCSEDDEQLIAALAGEAEPEQPEHSSEALVQAAVAPPQSRGQLRSIRLSVELLDRIMNGVSDAVLARNELARRLRDAPHDLMVDAAFDRVSGCIADIRDAITRTRMQRVDSLFTTIPRLVRDLAADLGKQVRIELGGGDVELDREMIEMIRDPMTHIVRNAIDHGIESPEERAAAGKPEAGSLRISARQSGNQILIEVADDGRGIDGDKLVRKAVTSGVISADKAERLTAGQKTALVFEPGLSTAGEVTAISGRGVGMDVVRANIERIGGLVDIDSKLGRGVRLTIRVPLTLTIIPALTVGAGGQIFAVPRAAIEEIVRVRGGAVRIETVGDARIATIRGRRIPLVVLSGLLDLQANGAIEDATLVVLKPAGGDLYALAVDGVHDHEELVVKPAAPAVMAAGVYGGTTLADDGRPVLLLDPSGMAGRAELRSDDVDLVARLGDSSSGARDREGDMLLLFRAMDGARRAIRLGVVERIEDVAPECVRFSAGRLRVVLGDRILPLEGCTVAPEGAKLRVLRLSDGQAEIAYGFAEVIDVRSAAVELRAAASPGEIAGVFLLDGEQIEMLDPYWLFAAHATGAKESRALTRRPVCALPPGDPWMEAMLRPLVESLGYQVVEAAEGVRADIIIASADDAPSAKAEGAHIVRIRSRPELGGENDNSIYRYDREALLSALATDIAEGGGHG